MKEYVCEDCKYRFSEPASDDRGFKFCPECKSQVIFPVHRDKTPVARTAKQRRKKKGRQMSLFEEAK